MRISSLFLVFLPMCAIASSAGAEEPYYFHKPGISKDTYVDDTGDCAELAGGVRVPHYSIYAQNPGAASNPYAVGIASLFIGFAEARQRRRLSERVVRVCMADKGYERRTIDRQMFAEIRKLKDDARIERLFALVTSAEASGRLLTE